MKTKMATPMEKFDDLFFAVLQNCEQIEPFLEIVFSFLARRTDFFRIMHKKNDKFGFPPGVAEKMLLKIFRKYQNIVLPSQKSGEIPKESNSSNKQRLISDVAPPAATTINVETSTNNETTEKPLPKERLSPSETSNGKKVQKPSNVAECFNGGMLEKYMWSQTGSDVDVRIPVAGDIKGKNICVEIKDKYLKVALKNVPEPKVLVEGELQWKVHSDESMWTLIPGEHVHVSLDKVEDRWWTCVIKGDQEIDKSKIDTTRDISEFDEQTQTDYQRVMFDHQQKMLGQPTSQEMKTHEMLKKAWDAPNSPFAGTPFDPSQVNISGNL